VSYTERVFQAARATFGKKVFAAWPQIVGEFEYALWRIWNPEFGPLNAEQLDYVTRLTIRALEKGVDHPNPYGAYYRWMRSTYSNEDVREQFKRYGDQGDTDYSGILGEVAA